MPEYLSPGVYVEEVPSGPRPIQGVGTSTTGFVGLTERGPTTPRLLGNWSEYVRWFGDVIDEGISFLPYAVRGFFENGGARLFVSRITNTDATMARLDTPTAVGAQDFRIEALGPGEWGSRIFVRIGEASSDPTDTNIFRVTVLYFRVAPPTPFVDPLDPANIAEADRRDPDVIEDYDDLDANQLSGNYVINRINNASTLVHVVWTDTAQPPAVPNALAFSDLNTTAGADGVTLPAAPGYIGDPLLPPDQRQGLAVLADIDEIALLSIPDEVHPSLDAANQQAVMNAVVNQCENLGDRFAVMQLGQNESLASAIIKPRDTSYGAVYHPWVRVFNPHTRDTLLVPPGGHVAGIYGRSDRERGVHKAPANEIVRDIVNRDINASRKPLAYTLSKVDQDVLNPKGINVIRDFRADQRGIRVWGARTLSSDPLWRYVNVRRIFNYVEESIDEGTQWVVFEPNDFATWARVRQSVSDFLLLTWRSGALIGATEDQAFFVRCGPETMMPADIDAGQLICEVGIAPVKPAEFVIFRIQHKMVELAAA